MRSKFFIAGESGSGSLVANCRPVMQATVKHAQEDSLPGLSFRGNGSKGVCG